MEAINRLLIGYAQEQNIEDGKKVRTDCTVVASNIHAPSDSSLLWDCVRVLSRYLQRCRALVNVPFTDHTRRAKRRFIAIPHAKSKKREALYRDLIKITDKTVNWARQAVDALKAKFFADVVDVPKDFCEELRNYISLAERVLDQTRRRVIDGETVPAKEKIVSIFEPHTDIIIKDCRDIHYGHKVCLTAGASGLVLDCVVEDGNPADATLAVDMLPAASRLRRWVLLDQKPCRPQGPRREVSPWPTWSRAAGSIDS